MTEQSGVSKSTELQPNLEIPSGGWETLIILQRHGRYNSGDPGDLNNLTEEECSNLGRLTDEGKTEVKKKTIERLQAIMSKDPDKTDFLLLYSPTYYYDNELLGQRAKDTIEAVAEVIIEELERLGLPRRQLLNTIGFKPDSSDDGQKVRASFKGGTTRADKRLIAPLALFSADFNKLLDENTKSSDEWYEAFYADLFLDEREAMGVEGPEEAVNKVHRSVAVEARLARKFHRLNPNRRLIIWSVTHAPTLELYVTRKIQNLYPHGKLTPEQIERGVGRIPPGDAFMARYNSAVFIEVTASGQAKTNILGKEYSLPIYISDRK